MKNNIKMKKVTSIIIGIGLVVLSACSSKVKKEESLKNTDSAIGVTVATPMDSNNETVNISGQVAASQTANISTRVMGYITKLTVKVGDNVNKGQLIATISNSDIIAKRGQAEAMMAEANAALTNAKKDYDRFTALYKQQSASAKELDNATLQYNAVKAKVEAAKEMRNEVNAMLEYTTLTAPFAGIVTQKFTDAGNIANPGMPIVSIEQKDSYEISASVPETDINAIKQGEEVSVNIKSANKSFKGTVTQINQSSQFSGGQYIIKVSIPEAEKKGLYAGMYADLALSKPKATDSKEVSMVTVPTSSIIKKDDLTGLYTISTNNTALLRWVRLGKTIGDNVEVLTGLEKNEQFIVSSEGKLYNGATVIVKK